jgi:hypothetical protein
MRSVALRTQSQIYIQAGGENSREILDHASFRERDVNYMFQATWGAGFCRLASFAA